MKIKLKKLDEQVIVVTGASSGIGLATARMAAEKGARVVLAARDEPSLQRAVEGIREKGGEAVFVVADVADAESVQRIAEEALETFGGFDTWINNAGVGIFGRVEEVKMEDARRLFDVDYWGVVHGSLEAIRHLREQGGALINIGSVTSDRTLILQGHYSAAKQAVKGFTDALRMELEEEKVPVSVTLIKPSSIATPYPQHAMNYMDHEPTLAPPVYSPTVAAEAILECAQRPVRELDIGAGGVIFSRLGSSVPAVMDRFEEAALVEGQKKKSRSNGTNGRSNLHVPVPGSGRARGDIDRHVMESSLYTRAKLNPLKTFLGAAGVGLAITLASRPKAKKFLTRR